MQEEKRNPEISERRKDVKGKEVYRDGFGTGSTKDGKAGKKKDNRKRMKSGPGATRQQTDLGRRKKAS